MQTIYILRHFKVKDTITNKLNSKEFKTWIDLYDNSALEYLDIDIPQVDKVYVSSQNRAMMTADYFKLDYEQSDLLREVETFPFMNTRLKFSKHFWLIISRVLWLLNITSKETKQDTIKRAKEFIEQLKNNNQEETVLIISHGLFLSIFIKELRYRKYFGLTDFHLKNGVIYKLQLS